MKSTSARQTATSLPRAPEDDAGSRSTRYLITMGIRVLCFILMATITPYGWYTWVFAAGAVFLPYIAVVIASTGDDHRVEDVQSPERALPAAPATPVRPATDAGSGVFRIHETPPPPPIVIRENVETRDRDAG